MIWLHIPLHPYYLRQCFRLIGCNRNAHKIGRRIRKIDVRVNENGELFGEKSRSRLG